MPGACAECGTPAAQNCQRCGAPYCKRECQVTAWPMHKYTCSAKVTIKESSPGHGNGVFACEAFEVGDELHSEKPLVVFENGWGPDAISQAIEALPDNKKKVVMGFTDAHSPPDEPTAHGLAHTNSIPLGFSNSRSPSTKVGIFPIACRMNHACKPNARYIWNAAAGCEKIIAMRPIAANEEVTVCYKDSYKPRSQRRSELARQFKFECKCTACETPSDESDARLAKIQELIDQVPVVGYANQRQALMMSENCLRLMKQEGVDTPLDLGTIHYDAYQMALSSGNRSKANSHIRSALWCGRKSGDDDAVAKYVAKLNDL